MRKASGLCCIFNFAPHYRKGVYLEMQSKMDCHFFFGDRVATRIKKLDYSVLDGQVRELKYLPLFSHFYWMRGAWSLSFNLGYSAYLLTGEPYCLSNWMVMLTARLTGRPAFLWSHGWYGDEGRLKTWVKKLFFRLANGVFLYGEYARKLMIKEGIPPQRLWVINNSLDHQKQKELRPQLAASRIYEEHFKRKLPTLLFLGRLTAVKKLDLLIDALARAKQEGRPAYNLVLIGDGNVRSNLEERVREYGLEENVWFYGACYEEEKIAELVFNADLVVSPGNVGLTVIHALSYGTPVITHDNFARQMPEFEAIIPGQTGAFFQEGNADSLLDTIEQWFEAHPEKSEKTIKRCWAIVDQRYNPEFQINVLMENLGQYKLLKAV